ncbi:MAG: glycosyltransferase family 4 protein [Candidatus Bathyarchaeia archaeon]
MSVTSNYQSYSGTVRNKVLIVGPLPPTVGGITTFIVGLLNSDLVNSYKLVAFGTQRPTYGIFKVGSGYKMGMSIGAVNLVRSGICTLSHLMAFPFSIVKNRPDIVHINTASYWPFWENALYVIVSKILLKRTILHIHGGEFDKFYQGSNLFSKTLIRRVMNLPERIIVLSPTWGRFFSNVLPSKKISILGNFADVSLYSNFDVDSKFSSDKVDVLFIGGTEAKRKGLYDFVEAASLVAKQCPNVFFTLVSCSGIKGLDALCEQKGIKNCTKLLGFISEKEKIKTILDSSIFVLPSYGENFPVALLEAMAAGLSIVASAVGAIPDVVKERINGFLIKPGDYETLAQRIVVLAKDSNLRKQIAKNNMITVNQNYSKTVITQKLCKEYDRLLNEASS